MTDGLRHCVGHTHTQMPASVEMDKNAWVPVVEIEDVGPEMVTRETQTEGLFYPSARTIAGMRKAELLQKTIQISTMDRIPKLHTYSPGKGKREHGKISGDDLGSRAEGLGTKLEFGESNSYPFFLLPPSFPYSLSLPWFPPPCSPSSLSVFPSPSAPGLWRMQVEHVLSHLKAHALGSPDFQNSMGSPQIGKVSRPTTCNVTRRHHDYE